MSGQGDEAAPYLVAFEVSVVPRANALPLNLPPRGLCREASAQYIGVGTTKFDEMVGDGRMPGALQIDGRKVWDRRALDRAFDALGEAAPEENEWDKATS